MLALMLSDMVLDQGRHLLQLALEEDLHVTAGARRETRIVPGKITQLCLLRKHFLAHA